MFFGAIIFFLNPFKTKPSINTTAIKNTEVVSTEWKKNITSLYSDSACVFSESSFFLKKSDQKADGVTLAFPSFYCKEEGFGMSTTTSWFIKDGTIKYSNVLSNKDIVDFDNEDLYWFGHYWFLNGEDPEVFIKKLIAELPTQKQRDYCFVQKNKENKNLFQISFDEAKLSLSEDEDALWDFCGPYGPTNGFVTFEKVGDVLLFLQLGQEEAMYDYLNIHLK